MNFNQPTLRVVHDGRTLHEIVTDLEHRHHVQIGRAARDALARVKSRRKRIGLVEELTVIPGSEMGLARMRTTGNILRVANRRGFETPTPEAALLLRQRLPQEDLGYPRVIVFHKPIPGEFDEPSLLSLGQCVKGSKTFDSLELVPAHPGYIQRADEAYIFQIPDPGDHRLELEVQCPLGRVRHRYTPCGSQFRYA